MTNEKQKAYLGLARSLANAGGVPIGTPNATIDEKLATTRWAIDFLLPTVRFKRKKDLNMTIMQLNLFEKVLAKVASGDQLTSEQLKELQNLRQDIRRKLDELTGRSMRP